MWRRPVLVLLPAVVAAAVAGVSTTQQPERYRAEAEVLVRLPPSAAAIDGVAPALDERLLGNELRVAAGSTVVDGVRAAVGDEPELDVRRADGTDVFTFTARSTDARLAALTADTYAAVYVEDRRTSLIAEYAGQQAVLDEELASIEAGEGDAARREEFERARADLDLSMQLVDTSGWQIVDAADVPASADSPDLVRNVTLAVLAGLAVGLLAAFAVARRDTRVRDDTDLTRATGVEVIARVPLLPRDRPGDVVSSTDPGGPAAEAFRSLAAAVRSAHEHRSVRVVQVTAAESGAGATTVAVNLAVTAARSGRRVALVDADLLRPGVHAHFDVDDTTGFADVLAGTVALPDAARAVDGISSLLVVPAGPTPANSSELLVGDVVREIVDGVGDSADLLVFDSPPLGPTADALALAAVVDVVIVVASAGHSDAVELDAAVARLDQIGVPVLGTVLNRS